MLDCEIHQYIVNQVKKKDLQNISTTFNGKMV